MLNKVLCGNFKYFKEMSPRDLPERSNTIKRFDLCIFLKVDLTAKAFVCIFVQGKYFRSFIFDFD